MTSPDVSQDGFDSISEVLTDVHLQAAQRDDAGDKRSRNPSSRPRSLFEQYGNNEPYTEPELEDTFRCDTSITKFFELLTGPSTNFYVGPKEKHYTIPKRLLYHHSDYARRCLEGGFSEVSSNAVWLPDVDLEVFQWLWQWMYTRGDLDIYSYYEQMRRVQQEEILPRECLLLCRLHVLTERLLFDDWSLPLRIRRKLEKCIEEARNQGYPLPLTPEAMEEVLLNSAPITDETEVEPETWESWNRKAKDGWKSLTTAEVSESIPAAPTYDPDNDPWVSKPVISKPYVYPIRYRSVPGLRSDISLRPHMIERFCDFDFCTTTDFKQWTQCFELDGRFAVELMAYIAFEQDWVKRSWEVEADSVDDVAAMTKNVAPYHSDAIYTAESAKQRRGIWPVLRIMCTSAGYTGDDFLALRPLLEADGQMTAEMLSLMVVDLLWMIEQWGCYRDEEIDVKAEKEEQERLEEIRQSDENFRRRHHW